MSLPPLLSAGLADASFLFLLGAGASLVLGALRVVNAAHGALAVLGMQVCRWAAPFLGPPASIAAATVVVAAVGAAMERVVLRRLVQTSPIAQVVGTAGLALVFVAGLAFGPAGSVPPEPRASGIATAIVLTLALLFAGYRFGSPRARASADLLRTGAVAAGAGLAGLAGASLPEASAPGLDTSLLLDAFAVVLAGGAGSLPGAFGAALLLALVRTLGAAALPMAGPWPSLLAVVAVLLVRPAGLFGRTTPAVMAAPLVRPTPLGARLLGATLLLVWMGAALLRPAVALPVGASAAVAILAASSLSLVAGPGGIPSFGPAACFGVGALAASLLGPVVGGAGALAGAPVVSAGAGLLLGLVLVRLPPASVAMLSFWLALLVWHVAPPVGDVSLPAFGRDGSLGFVVVTGLGAALLLRRLAGAPFGFALRAARDDSGRASAIGLPVLVLRLAAQTVAGAAAGLAGGLSLLGGGEAFGHPLAVASASVLGGLHAISGPIVGGLAVSTLAEWATRFWPAGWAGGSALLGVALFGAVLLLPDGIAGGSFRFWRRPA